MIYTIGHKESYLKAMDNKPVIKVGKSKDYTGGYAFMSVKDAQRRIDEAYHNRDFAVFGLDTNWQNTEPSQDGWWNYLVKEAEILIIDNSG